MRLLAYGTLCGGFLSEQMARQAGAAATSPTGAARNTSASSTPPAAGRPSRASWRRRRQVAPQARRLDLQRRDALGAGAPGGRRGDHRRAARRERAPRRQSEGLRLRARRRGPRAARRGLRRDHADPRRLRRRIPPARPTSPRRATSAITSTPSRRSSRRCRCPAGRAACACRRAASGSRSPATAARCASRTRSASPAPRRRMAADRCVAPGDPGAQTTYILDKIAASIAALGGKMEDVVRTRIYLRDAAKWEPVSRAHGRVFGDDHAGQHAGRGRRPDRRLRGRDRSRGGGRG